MHSIGIVLKVRRERKRADTTGTVPVSGVATGWTGVDMSTPLLLKVAPEIDTNPTSFYRAVGGVAPPLDPSYRLALRALHVCPPHIF